MKLLVDKNLSPKIIQVLAGEFPASIHVDDTGLIDPDDRVLWQIALDGGYAVLSKDNDFFFLSQTLGHPPKVLLLTVGNCSTRDCITLLRRHLQAIYEFDADPKAALLMLP